MNKMALLGGTFDPIHKGHLFIADRARERCGLDQVVFVPCWRSPHKQNTRSASPKDRLELCELECCDLEWAEVCRWEIDREEPSYSWQTAEYFREKRGKQTRLFWILGADQWTALPRWSRPDYLRRLVEFIVFPRDDLDLRSMDGYRAVFLKDSMEVSSTRIREAFANGEPVEEWVSPEVESEIRSRGLYGVDKAG